MDHISPSAQTALKPDRRLTDAFRREITYLRLSVTDRCNLRCQYCMGKEVKFLPKADVLTLEELERLCAAFVRLGVRKLRLTGGEPLLRPGVMGLIERLGTRVASGELDELTLTTNGTLLANHVTSLAAAGVRRVNVSLDTLDAATFRQITQRDGLADVLAGIHAARAAHLAVRINIVAMAGVSDAEYDRMIHWCGSHGCDMALIVHVPDGYLSPATCAVTYAIALPFWCIAFQRVKRLLHTRMVLLLAVFSSFSFVIMMFNLPLPGGTTGHAVGMAVAAIVLGPWASMVAISIALLILAVFFGDGGITTFRANCLNMAVVGSLVAYWTYSIYRYKRE